MCNSAKIKKDIIELIRYQKVLATANGIQLSSWEALKAGIISSTKAMAKWLLATPTGWAVLATTAVLGLAAAFNYVSKAGERAREATEEAISNYENISSEVDSVASSIKELNEQINGLDPIADSEDIKNLETEKGLLEAELAILKEKQRLAKEEADNAAQESLNTTQGSKYATDDQLTYYGESVGYASMQTPKQVTQYEELDLAMDKYAEYQKELSDLQAKFKNMKEGDEEYSETAQKIADLGEVMKEVKTHANELAISVQDQVKGLSGDTEESKKLKDAISDVINKYVDFIEVTDTSTKSLNANAEAQQNASRPSESELNKNVNDSFDTIKNSYDVLKEFEEAMSSGMTESALDGVAELSDELKTMVAGFHAGAVSADQLYSALTEHYNNDLKNYGKALIAKNEYSEDFYNAIGLADSEFINSMYNGYEVDLSNCKNYNEAKLAIEAQAINKLGDMWSKYYNAQIGSYTAEFQSLARSIEILERTGQSDKAAPLKEIAQKVGQQVRNYQAAINKLDDAVYSGITSNFKGISSGLDNNSDKGSGGGSSGSETEEVIDHIATKIERLERQIESLGKTAGATYKDWQERNEALSDQITLTTEEIALQEEALAYYQKKANSVGLSKEYQDLVKYGGIRIDTIKDENLSKKISEYQEWYEKILACEDAIEDLNAELANLAKQKFDNISSEFDNKFSSIEHEMNVLEALIEKTETRGHVVSTKYYESLIEAEKKNIELLEKEYEQLIDELSNAMETGDIEEGSEDFYEMKEAINEVKLEIIEANTELIEFENSIRDLEWENFDRLQEKISAITDEADFLISLMEDSDLYDDNGQLTDTGMGTLGLRAQNYNVLMNQADKYAAEVEKINAELANDPNNQELLDRKQELIELQRESILAANDEKNAIRDMVQEGIDLELEALQERIDKIKETQEEMQALYEYQKKVSEQTKNIANLEKQLSAYEGDDSEENQARIQQIKLDLEEARKTLEETETEYALSETQKMLDELYSEYELILSERMDNIDALLEDMIGTVNENASTINETLAAESEKVGYTISDSIQDIWSNEGAATAIVTKYGDEFNSQLTSVNNVLNAIATEMGAIVEESDKEAEEDIKTETAQPEIKPSEPKPSPTTPPPSSDTKKEETKSITVGGKINAGNAKIYDYAGDKSPENQYYSKDPIYVVLKEKDGYLQVRHHSLKSGITGWFKKSDVKAYKTGGLADETGLAWLDGTKSKPEMVLNAKDTQNFIELTDILRKAARDDVSLLNIDKFFDDIKNFSKYAQPEFNSFLQNIPQNTSSGIGNMNNVFNMNFELHNVQDGEAMIDYLINSKRFENVMQAATIDRLVGGSQFAKNKYRR